jgi:hypothetical protein
VYDHGLFVLSTSPFSLIKMFLALRSLGHALLVVLFFGPVLTQAQETGLRSDLRDLRAQVDSSLELLRPILGGEPLASWNGSSELPPSQVNATLEEVVGRLEELRTPLLSFAEMAEARLTPESAAPVLDDIGIATRDLDLAIAQLPLAAHAHEGQMSSSAGCKHDNVALLRAVELVRDISATLLLIDGTFESFGITDAQ